MSAPHTRNQVIARILLAIALFAIANVAAYHYSSYFQTAREYHAVMAEIQRHPNVSTLFAGDSHFARPLNDLLNRDARGKTYSVAFGGDSLRECYAKIRHILNRRRDVHTLFISADPHMFGAIRLESSNRSFANRYFLLAGDRANLREGWFSALLDQVPLFNDDFVQFERKALAAHWSSRRRAQSLPVEEDVPWSQRPPAERDAKARETGEMDHRGIGKSAEPFVWYARILKLARMRGVRVIGVRLPVNPGYSAFAPQEQVAVIDRYLMRQGISQIVDLRDALDDPRGFRDSDHVNPRFAGCVMRTLYEQVDPQPEAVLTAESTDKQNDPTPKTARVRLSPECATDL
jgi:hypothetical protein